MPMQRRVLLNAPMSGATRAEAEKNAVIEPTIKLILHSFAQVNPANHNNVRIKVLYTVVIIKVLIVRETDDICFLGYYESPINQDKDRSEEEIA